MRSVRPKGAVAAALLFLLVPRASLGAMTLAEIWERSDPASEEGRLSEARVLEAEARVGVARASIFPALSAIGDWRKYEAGFTEPQRTARLSLVQPLFRGFREFAALNVVRETRNAAQLEREQERIDRFARVAEAAYAVWTAESDLADLREQARLTGLRRKEIEARVRIGRSRPGDLLASDAQLASLEAEIESAISAISDARARFREITTLPAETEVAAPSEKRLERLPPLDPFLEGARTRPGIRALERRLESTESEVSVAKGGHLPSLDFGANYYLHRNGFPAASQWDFGFTLAFPIFSGGAVLAETRAASARRFSAENTLTLERRRAEEATRAAHASLASASKRLTALDRAVRLNRENHERNLKDYRLGLVTNLEVLQSLASSLDALRSLHRTRAEQAVALIRLHALAGRFPEGFR